MLYITVPASGELWDEQRQEFVQSKEQTLQLEHSLVSLSKWEARWQKPFLSKSGKSFEETLDYIRCMTLTQNVKPETYLSITDKNIDLIYEYINAPMTATTFPEDKFSKKRNNRIITSELIYYWMIALNIPLECQKWHLNRLITLIRVCEIESRPPKKLSKREIMSRNAALNAVRKQQYNTRG